MQHILIEPRLCRRRDRCKAEYEDHVTTHPMILINRLCVLGAAEQRWCVVLGNADNGLQEEEDVGDQTKDSVW